MQEQDVEIVGPERGEALLQRGSGGGGGEAAGVAAGATDRRADQRPQTRHGGDDLLCDRLQPAQCDAGARRGKAELAGDDDAIAPAPHCLAKQRLGFAVAVQAGDVEMGDPGIERRGDGAQRCRPADASHDAAAAEPEPRRWRQAGSQSDVFHAPASAAAEAPQVSMAGEAASAPGRR